VKHTIQIKYIVKLDVFVREKNCMKYIKVIVYIGIKGFKR